MRKLFTLTLLSIVVLFTQCKKDATVSDAPKTETIASGSEAVTITQTNQLAVQNVLKLPNKELVKLGFSALEPVERYLFWVTKINKAAADLTPAQRVYATQLLSFIKVRHFTLEYRSELQLFAINWYEKAKTVLTQDQINKLMFDMSPEGSKLDVNGVDTGVNTGTTCECSKSSDWCRSIMDDQGRDRNTCDFAACKKPDSKYGCGAMGMYTCDGMCVYQNLD